MKTEIITINSKHYKPGTNTFEYPLGTNATFEDGDTIALHAFAMYNSTYNISSDLENNRITLEWIDGSFYNLTIDDGYYSVDELNEWLKNQCFNLGLYTTRNNAQELLIYYRFVTNPVRYKNQILIYYIPTAAEATSLGISKPTGVSWNFQSVRKLPKLTICLGLLRYFGMRSKLLYGDETDQTKNYDYLSEVTPTISTVFSILLTCNLVSNNYNNANEIIGQVAIDANFGSVIKYYNTGSSGDVSIKSKSARVITIRLYDQELRPLQFNDYDFVCSLILKTK